MNDYLDRVEQQLTALTERGAHHRLRARRPTLGRAGGGGPTGPRGPWLTEGLAVLAAAAVVAAVVAIVLVNAHHSTSSHSNAAAAAGSVTHSATTSTHAGATAPGATTAPYAVTTTATTPAATIPAKFAPQSFTAVSELTWWVLGPAACQFAGAKPPCGQILRTTDGGQHFTGIGSPNATLSSGPN
ncbi:MAG: hypothetical protein ACRDPA_34510, partial [Solirubrobacteraceae bacterium]